MIWLTFLCVILSITVIALCIKIILMQKSAEKISEELTEKLKSDTNTLISIATQGQSNVPSCE